MQQKNVLWLFKGSWNGYHRKIPKFMLSQRITFNLKLGMNTVFKRYFSLFLTWAPFIVHTRPTTCLTVSVYWSFWWQNLWYLFCFVLHLYLLFCCCLFYYLYSMASSRIQVFIIGLWLGLWCLIFNNISVISWRSVFLVEETGIPGENHRPAPSHWQTLWHKVVSSIPRRQRDSKSNL